MRAEIEKAVELIRRKDPKSLDAALALLQNTAFSFSMKVCGQRQDAEDTMQEVLLKSVAKLSKFDNPKALMVWLYKVAKSRCLISRRKSKFAPKSDLSLEQLMPDRRELRGLADNPDRTPEKLLLRREYAKQLRDAVQKLPPAYRLILVLHDMEELSDREISEITGLRPGTIRVRLHRSRLFVRRELALRNTITAATAQHTKPANSSAANRKLETSPVPLRRCKRIFSELSNYLDDELDESLCAELENHIEGCGPCIAFLASLEKSIEECRRSPEEFPDPAMAAKLRREVMAGYHGLMANVSASRRSS